MKGKKVKDNYELEKYIRWFTLLNVWIYVKNKGARIEDFFALHGYKRIAIYGCGDLGCRLFEELKNSDVEVCYMIDRNALNIKYQCEVIPLKVFAEKNNDIDAVIVSPIQEFEKLKPDIENITSAKVVSLEEVIDHYVS